MASSVLRDAHSAACAPRASTSKQQKQGKAKPGKAGAWASHVRQGHDEVALWSTESRPRRGAVVRMSAENGSANSTATLDVAGACVDPVFRSAPRPEVRCCSRPPPPTPVLSCQPSAAHALGSCLGRMPWASYRASDVPKLWHFLGCDVGLRLC